MRDGKRCDVNELVVTQVPYLQLFLCVVITQNRVAEVTAPVGLENNYWKDQLRKKNQLVVSCFWKILRQGQNSCT